MTAKQPARRLYLLRHAKSSWDDPALADHDRPAGGARAARRRAARRALRGAAVAPQLVLCSTSARTRETLALLELAGEPVVVYERGLYAAPARVLLERLRAIRDDIDSAMLVGHSSGIEDLALLLARGGESLGRLREKFPTGALASLEFGGAWRDLDARSARLVEFVTPRALDELDRPRKP